MSNLWLKAFHYKVEYFQGLWGSLRAWLGWGQ